MFLVGGPILLYHVGGLAPTDGGLELNVHQHACEGSSLPVCPQRLAHSYVSIADGRTPANGKTLPAAVGVDEPRGASVIAGM